ncbi:hypothetical protein K438DRAFT_2045760 [Mycena galopus ATCC 62051]|nr:hypothetical protein K438DRAFT_2045760 [Mycena galopus ATCC 62051]
MITIPDPSEIPPDYCPGKDASFLLTLDLGAFLERFSWAFCIMIHHVMFTCDQNTSPSLGMHAQITVVPGAICTAYQRLPSPYSVVTPHLPHVLRMTDWLNAQLHAVSVTTKQVDHGIHVMDDQTLPLSPEILRRIGDDAGKKNGALTSISDAKHTFLLLHSRQGIECQSAKRSEVRT